MYGCVFSPHAVAHSTCGSDSDDDTVSNNYMLWRVWVLDVQRHDADSAGEPTLTSIMSNGPSTLSMYFFRSFSMNSNTRYS